MSGVGLQATGVYAHYGRVEALRGVDIQVSPGQLHAVLGANGAGKSTLLGVLAGHVPLTHGRVQLAGQPLVGPPHRRARRGLGYVADDRCLFPSLTVRQSLRMVGGSVEQAAGLFPPLAQLHARGAGLCSGGEQQMLALARALATEPTVLLVDELSLGLAPGIRDDLLAALRQQADAGMAVLIVEQHVEAALAVADHAHLLHRGQIVDHGPAADWRGRGQRLMEVMLS